jgi:hypothetical protein
MDSNQALREKLMSRLENDPAAKNHAQETDEMQQAQAGEQMPESAHHRLEMPEETVGPSDRLLYVEHLLRSAPLLAVPFGFADRVVALLKKQAHTQPSYAQATGIVLGLAIAALVTVLPLGTLIYFLVRSLFSAGPRELALRLVGNVAENVALWAQDPSISLPLALLLIFALLPLSALSGYLFWFFSGVAGAGSSDQPRLRG